MKQGAGWAAATAGGGLALGAAVALLPQPLALALPVAAIATTAAFIAPLNAVVAVWAALLPIWAVGPVPPVAFDVARVAGAVVIALRSRERVDANRVRALTSWAWPLVLLGAMLAAVGATQPDARSLASGTVMLVSVPLAWAALARYSNPGPVLGGYLTGATVSALVLIGSALGFTALAPQSDAGALRLTGLAPSAPKVGVQLAVAVAIAVALWTSRGPALRPQVARRARLAALVCATALMMSGGRVGVAGLAIAALVAVTRGWLRWRHLIGSAAVGGVVLWAAPRLGFELNTLTRLLEDPAQHRTDFSSGRIDLIPPAVRLIGEHFGAGYGLVRFDWEYGALPHSPILVFGLAAGGAAMTLALLASWRIARHSLFAPRSAVGASRAAHLTFAVMLAAIILEPDGPFVGVEMVTLLLLGAGLVDHRVYRRPLEQVDPRVGVGGVLAADDQTVGHARRPQR